LIGILVAMLAVGVMAKRQLTAGIVSVPATGEASAAAPNSPQTARNLPAQVQSQVEAAQAQADRKLRAAADSGSP